VLRDFRFGAIVLIVGAASFVAVFALPISTPVSLVAAVVAAAVLYGAVKPVKPRSQRRANSVSPVGPPARECSLGSDKIALPALDELLVFLHDYEGPGRPLATENQRKAVARLGFGTPERIFLDQAHALLSARSYAEVVLYGTGRSLDDKLSRYIEARLTAFIVTHRDLRRRAIAWSDQHFARGRAEVASPKQDEHWDKVVAEAKRLRSLFGR
jgi:hypothetical protein